jgi:hypothetical protein
MTDRRCLRCGEKKCDCPPLKKGDKVPILPRKLDIRPAFTGSGQTSFKPARNNKR